MSEQTLLRQILEANKSFLAGSTRLLDPSGDPFVIVACTDPRLTGLLEPALGLPRHRAVVVRTAGNQISAKNHDVLRSIAVGLFVKGAREVLVVGHTDCAMAAFAAAQVAENFRKAGIARSAFGDEDLRTWFGAFSTVEANLADSVNALRQSGLLPAGGKVHGLMMDTVSGAITVAADGDIAPASVPTPEPAPPRAKVPEDAGEKAHVERAPESQVPIPPLPAGDAGAPAQKPIVIGTLERSDEQARTAKTPLTYVDAVMQLRQVLNEARQDAGLRRAIRDLTNAVRGERDPVRVFSALEQLERECAPLYPEVVPAVEALKKSVRSRKDGLNFMEMMRRILG
jgi:carbonic anhydrase